MKIYKNYWQKIQKSNFIIPGESRKTLKLSYRELFNEVCSYAASLKKLNVQVGDRVAGFQLFL